MLTGARVAVAVAVSVAVTVAAAAAVAAVVVAGTFSDRAGTQRRAEGR